MGERLRTADGSIRIESIESIEGVHRVYNLEVETQHSYFVSEAAVLSHNSNPCGIGGTGNNTFESITRPTRGSDGGISTQIIERTPDGTAISRAHRVEVDGEVVHQHQTHIGANGGQRQFPDEWTGTQTINNPPKHPDKPYIREPRDNSHTQPSGK